MEKNKEPIKEIKENIPRELEDEKIMDTYRIYMEKEKITLFFGKWKDKGDSPEVDVVSKVTFSPKMLQKIVSRLYMAGVRYEKKFNEKIGFKTLDNEREDTKK